MRCCPGSPEAAKKSAGHETSSSAAVWQAEGHTEVNCQLSQLSIYPMPVHEATNSNTARMTAATTPRSWRISPVRVTC